MDSATSLASLPPAAHQGVEMVVEALQGSLGESLVGILLFGSGAEGRLRALSDVNLLAVAHSLDLAALESARETLRSAQALAKVKLMLLDAGEVEDAARAFPEKFDDVMRRHLLVAGVHPFPHLVVDPRRLRERLDQVLLNQVIRLREQTLIQGLREEQATRLLASTAGHLRACAASLLSLQGQSLAPKESLAAFVDRSAPRFRRLLEHFSAAREQRRLEPGAAASALGECLELAQALRQAVKGLPA